MIPIFLRSFTQYKKSWASPVHNIPRRSRHLVVGKTMNCGTEHDVYDVCVKFEQPRFNARRSSIWLWKMHLIWQQSDEARRELAKAKVLSWMQAIFLRYYTKPCLASELTRLQMEKPEKWRSESEKKNYFPIYDRVALALKSCRLFAKDESGSTTSRSINKMPLLVRYSFLSGFNESWLVGHAIISALA